LHSAGVRGRRQRRPQRRRRHTNLLRQRAPALRRLRRRRADGGRARGQSGAPHHRSWSRERGSRRSVREGSGMTSLVLWGGFTLFVLALLALDLGVLNRGTAVLPVRAAVRMSVIWMAVAAAFGAGLVVWRGAEDGVAFSTGYLLEYALSLDNVFV